MSLQDAVSASQPIGFVGQKVDGREYDAVTRLVEDAAGLAWGKPVIRGTADNQVKIAGATIAPATFVGVSVRDVSVRPSAGDKYPRYGNATILTKGSIWVRVGEAVADGDAAYWDAVAGAWLKTDTDDSYAVPNARFDSTAALNGLAILTLG